MMETATRLDDLERRLGRVERHLGLAAEPIAVPPTARPLVRDTIADVGRRAADWRARQEERAVPIPAIVPSSQPPPLPPPLPPPPLSVPSPMSRVSRASSGVLPYHAAPQPSREPAKQSALEQLIGLKLAGWVGAIVLVIGVGLGIKYAYDQGWFGGVPPVVKLSLLSFAGFALIGTGEYVYRRISKISATGLFGAGVATLFLVSYAGHGYYQLYEQKTAFTLMAMSTLVGAAVAMRGRFVSIAVLSLIGGLLAPMLLRGDSHLVTPFLAYLLMLQVVALTLSWWGRSARWWTLRGLSLAGTTLWTAVLLPDAHPWGAVMLFTFLYAALYQIEVILSTLRRREIDEAAAGITFSVIVMAAATAATLWIFHPSPPPIRGAWVIGFSAIAFAASVAINRFRQDAASRALAYGYRAQAVVLLILAVPVALSGAGISFGWAGLALALAAIGAKLDDRRARMTAGAAWALAVANCCMWAGGVTMDRAAHRVVISLLGQPLQAWMFVAWGLVACGHGVSWLIRRRDPSEASFLSAIATAMFVITSIVALPPIGATATILIYAWILVGVDLAIDRPVLLVQACSVIALAAMKWVVVDSLAGRFAPGWATHYTPIVNPQILTGVALAGSIVAIYRLRHDTLASALAKSHRQPAVLVLSIVTLLICVGLTFEVDRVVTQLTVSAWPIAQLRQMSWTILWSAAAVTYLWLFTKLDATARTRITWRGGAWAIAALLAMKFIILDSFAGFGMARGTPAPLMNFQILTALAVTASLILVHLLLRDDNAPNEDTTALRVSLAALGVILWAGTLEIDRLVTSGVFPGAAIWPGWQLKNFGWTAWWTAGVTAFLFIAVRRDATLIRRLPMLRAMSALPILLTAKYVIIDTLAFRIFGGPVSAAVAANLQTLAGAIVFAALVVVRNLLSDAEARETLVVTIRRFAGAAAIVMLLWIGTLEIDRAFVTAPAVIAAFTDAGRAEQVALSIFWSGFAIACVIGGFRFRIAGLRYFGLALFAFTLLKIGVVDLRSAQTGYRILSFMGLGALLLVTSVLYGKLSPVLLREDGAPGENATHE